MAPILLRLLVALALAGAGDVLAAPLGEYQLKAAFLLNFARYVEWPAAKLAPGAPLRVCILGRDPFGAALAEIEGKQAQGHEVRTRLVDSAEHAAECHLLFVTDSEERRVTAILRALATRAILTVSDLDGFVETGGAVGLVNEDDRIRFDVNYTTLQRESLKASAQLLRLGRNVIGMRAP